VLDEVAMPDEADTVDRIESRERVHAWSRARDRRLRRKAHTDRRDFTRRRANRVLPAALLRERSLHGARDVRPDRQLDGRMIEGRIPVHRDPVGEIARRVDRLAFHEQELNQVDVFVVVERRRIHEGPIFRRADGRKLRRGLVKELPVELGLEDAPLIIALDVLNQDALGPVRRWRLDRVQDRWDRLRRHGGATLNRELHHRAVGVRVDRIADGREMLFVVPEDDLRARCELREIDQEIVAFRDAGLVGRDGARCRDSRLSSGRRSARPCRRVHPPRRRGPLRRRRNRS
jgi:hypothetical protein